MSKNREKHKISSKSRLLTNEFFVLKVLTNEKFVLLTKLLVVKNFKDFISPRILYCIIKIETY
jgi:hypothetical protein